MTRTCSCGACHLPGAAPVKSVLARPGPAGHGANPAGCARTADVRLSVLSEPAILMPNGRSRNVAVPPRLRTTTDNRA